MTRMRRAAIGAVLAGVLGVTGLAAAGPANAAAPASAADGPSTMMWLQYGPYSTLEVCDIVRALHGPKTSQCGWHFYDWRTYGWYFGSDH
jgi:hypothetical protein